MRKELFDDLIESQRSRSHQTGLVAPARVTTFEMPDESIRTKAKLKQNEFACVGSIPPLPVQAWEHKRTPTGSSLKLLRVIEKHPDMLNLFRTA
jgi:putative transcriptional regulator